MSAATPGSESYFKAVQSALNQAGIAHPVLIIDKARLDHNIECLKRTLAQGFDYRIVAKSLPCIPLLQYIMASTQTNRLMCFHLPFLKHVTQQLPASDVLIGKPMPVEGVRQFYYGHAKTSTFNPDAQLQWLVDSERRLLEYEALANKLKRVLQINLEVDVGLHRGGFGDMAEFKRSLERIKQSEYLKLSGLMGYEAHITKIPSVLGGPKKAERQAKESYQNFIECIQQCFGELPDLCLNMGGSTTYPLYQSGDACNELATASALVKPSDFDVYTLAQHEAAAFIATPILKRVEKPELPMAKGLSRVMRALGLLPDKACFIYGGNWLAKPCYPDKSKRVDLFGASSNQEMYSLHDDALGENDFMFFRPTQSEAVFLQFGQLAVYDNGTITERWPVFSYPDVKA